MAFFWREGPIEERLDFSLRQQQMLFVQFTAEVLPNLRFRFCVLR